MATAWKCSRLKTVLSIFGLTELASLNVSGASYSGKTMTIATLIQLLENSLVALAEKRALLVRIGDIAGVIAVDAERDETETTLTTIKQANEGV